MAVFLTAALLLVGCSDPSAKQVDKGQIDEQTAQGIVYSNLADEASQKEVSDILTSHGVSKGQVDMLMVWAKDFNGRVRAGRLSEGFEPMEETGVSYGGLVVENKKLEQPEQNDQLDLEKELDSSTDDLLMPEQLAPEANCRLTSYLLLKDRIKTNGKQLTDDTILMFDIEAIDSYSSFRLDGDKRSNFISLFNWVPVKGTSTLSEHIQKIEAAWKDRAVEIGGKEDGVSLITVYLHLPFDEVRFVGHTGVLLEQEGGLLFVEKYGPALPFQATKLQNREQLKKYLLSRPDLYGDETELEPIIMENDTVL